MPLLLCRTKGIFGSGGGKDRVGTIRVGEKIGELGGARRAGGDY